MNKHVETDSDDLAMEAASTKPDKKLVSSQRTNQIISTKATLKEVVISSPVSRILSNHGRIIPPPQSASSHGSALSSERDQSSEYDTPGTSTAVTPAESLGRRGSLTGISRKPGQGRSLGQAAQIGTRNKRKHEDILGDALLAQALQEEEYREDKPTPGPSKRRRTVTVEDSEDEELSLSDVDDVDPVETGHHSAKGSKTGGRLSLPTRAARESAIKSMTNRVPREVMDTDTDDSELSEYNSDEDLEDLEGSDASDDDMSVFRFTAPGDADADEDAAAATETLSRSAAASTVRRLGRRMPLPAAAGRSRYSRNSGYRESRVSILHSLDHDFQQFIFLRPSLSVRNLKRLIPRSRPCGIH